MYFGCGNPFFWQQNAISSIYFWINLIFIIQQPWEKNIFFSFVILFISFQFIISSNVEYKSYFKQTYESFYGQINTLRNITGVQKWKKTRRVEGEQSLQTKTTYYTSKHEGNHRRIFLAAIDVWKMNRIFEKIFGSGIKSFREDCWKLEGQPDVYLGEALMPNKKNLLCSNHPHNYYLEILTETGIVGLFIIFAIASLFIAFIIKNLKFIKNISIENFILLSAIISLILETFPLRSAGSLFSTGNATYLILISTIVLSHKALIKINNSK